MSKTPATEAFGELVRELRGRRKQTAFGVFLGGGNGTFGRGTISWVETGGRPPTPELVDALIRCFPDAKATIDASYDALLAAEAHDVPAEQALSRQAARRIELLISSGRQGEAHDAILAALRDTEDPQSRIRLYELAGDAYGSRRLIPQDVWTERSRRQPTLAAVLRPLSKGIALADEAGLLAESVRLRDKLADHLIFEWEYDRALKVIDEGLSLHHHASMLWLRRGQVRWHQGCFADAYGALKTALKLGAPRAEVALALGHVLVEWEKEEEAVTEFIQGFASPLDPITEACARGAFGYALMAIGESDGAKRELRRALELSLPGHAWTRYFLALHHHRFGRSRDRTFKEIQDALANRETSNLMPAQLWHLSSIIDQEWPGPDDLRTRTVLYRAMGQHFAVRHEIDTQGRQLNAMIVERVGRPREQPDSSDN